MVTQYVCMFFLMVSGLAQSAIGQPSIEVLLNGVPLSSMSAQIGSTEVELIKKQAQAVVLKEYPFLEFLPADQLKSLIAVDFEIGYFFEKVVIQGENKQVYSIYAVPKINLDINSDTKAFSSKNIFSAKISKKQEVVYDLLVKDLEKKSLVDAVRLKKPSKNNSSIQGWNGFVRTVDSIPAMQAKKLRPEDVISMLSLIFKQVKPQEFLPFDTLYGQMSRSESATHFIRLSELNDMNKNDRGLFLEELSKLNKKVAQETKEVSDSNSQRREELESLRDELTTTRRELQDLSEQRDEVRKELVAVEKQSAQKTAEFLQEEKKMLGRMEDFKSFLDTLIVSDDHLAQVINLTSTGDVIWGQGNSYSKPEDREVFLEKLESQLNHVLRHSRRLFKEEWQKWQDAYQNFELKFRVVGLEKNKGFFWTKWDTVKFELELTAKGPTHVQREIFSLSVTDSKKGFDFSEDLFQEVAGRIKALMKEVHALELVGTDGKQSFLTQLANSFRNKDYAGACDAASKILKSKF